MSDLLAQGQLRRIVTLFARHGESFILTHAGVDRTLRGLFTPMDGQTTGVYFDANETVGLQKPALSLFLDGSLTSPPLVDDVFTRDGRLWTVRKMQFFRLGDTNLLIQALCD